ncbi:Hypothetical protein KVN_LOCUS89 [uncultured virus]|nr:Hypothetical protein KVN_LOCUS89 [uncultured virus]
MSNLNMLQSYLNLLILEQQKFVKYKNYNPFSNVLFDNEIINNFPLSYYLLNNEIKRIHLILTEQENLDKI